MSRRHYAALHSAEVQTALVHHITIRPACKECKQTRRKLSLAMLWHSWHLTEDLTPIASGDNDVRLLVFFYWAPGHNNEEVVEYVDEAVAALSPYVLKTQVLTLPRGSIPA